MNPLQVLFICPLVSHLQFERVEGRRGTRRAHSRARMNFPIDRRKLLAVFASAWPRTRCVKRLPGEPIVRVRLMCVENSRRVGGCAMARCDCVRLRCMGFSTTPRDENHAKHPETKQSTRRNRQHRQPKKSHSMLANSSGVSYRM